MYIIPFTPILGFFKIFFIYISILYSLYEFGFPVIALSKKNSVWRGRGDLISAPPKVFIFLVKNMIYDKAQFKFQEITCIVLSFNILLLFLIIIEVFIDLNI